MTANPKSSHWQSLVKTALLGTERSALDAPAQDNALGEFLARTSNGNPKQILLSSAAVIGAYQRAGQKPLRPLLQAPTLSQAADLPRLGSKAAQFLARMLAGENRPLLPEFLEAVAHAGKRVAEESLPGLLNLGRSSANFRPLIVRVIGRRGHWLAGQNPEWNYISSEEPIENLWQTGAASARLLVLGQLRQSDPAAARSMLESTWKNEPAADRAAFLGVFRFNLSMEDEPFLERALDDKGKDVRKVAADLLAMLPASRFVQRMTERALLLLQWKDGKRSKIEVTLPSVDPAMQRDGIDTASRRQGVGDKALALYQILCATPPQALCKPWSKTAAQIIEAARDREWRDVLLEAWTVGASRLNDPVWAEALWGQDLKGGVELSPWDAFAKLAPALPENRRQTLMAERIKQDPHRGSDTSDVPQMLRAYDQPWGKTLARAVLELLRKLVTQKDSSGRYRLRSALPDFARRIPTNMLSELSADWPSDAPGWDYWKQPIDEFLSIVQFRKEMVEHL